MLKLKATSNDDLSVLSACLQDTAIQVGDILWQPSEKRFGFIGQRYEWERERETGERVRTNCRVWFEGVKAVQRRSAPDTAPATLEFHAAVQEDPHTVLLHFAAGEAARLQLAHGWTMYLEDFGAPWPAEKCPSHPS